MSGNEHDNDPTDWDTSENLLLKEVEYQWEETPRGTWRRFVYPNGQLFEEFTSHARLGKLPWFHFTRGKCPETGKRIVAHGVIAVGRLAKGFVAIGQASMGLIAIGQLAIGLFIGFGQGCTGLLAVGQVALAVWFGLGQVAVGHIVIAQVGFGTFALAQWAWASHVWDSVHKIDPVAKEMFQPVIDFFRP